ncbi:MAG: SRPBCC family protein [Acidimicrobiales bacterium]
MRITHTEDIAAPAAVVWEQTVAVESLPSLTPTITEVERLDKGPLEVGSRVRIKQPGQRARVWTITAFEPERLFSWSTAAMGMTMTGIHELSHAEGITSNSLTIELSGRLAPILGPLLVGPLHKALAAENDGFKSVAEQQLR